MKTLKARLIALNTLLMVVTGLVLVSLSIVNMRGEILQGVDREFAALLGGQTAVVRTWVAEKTAHIANQADIAAEADALRFLRQGAKSGGFFVNYIGFSDGRTVFSDGWQAPADYNAPSRDWYRQATAAGRPIVTRPYLDEATKKLTVTLAAPFAGPAGTGVVAGDVFVGELVRSVLQAKPRGDGLTFIVDRKGTIIAHPKADLALTPIAAVAPELDGPALEAMAGNPATREVTVDGRVQLMALQPIPGTDWLMGAQTDKAAILAPLDRLVATVAGLSAVAILLMIPLSGWVFGRMLRGLADLQAAMTRIAGEDADLSCRLKDDGQDEIAATARAFNLFVAGLNTLFGNLMKRATGLIGGVADGNRLIESAAAASRQMADASSTNAATLEEITVSIAHIADNALSADALVQSTGDTLRQSAGTANRLSAQMLDTLDRISRLESMLASLGKRSEEISGSTEEIRDIADQTNLLALNAAIEAARAGEQGRGFSVVADEVRQLAERTAHATRDITALIGAIHQDTACAVEDIRSTAAAVAEGERLGRESADSIGTVEAAMREIAAAMNAISLSTREQHEASVQLAQSTETINNQVQSNDELLQRLFAALQQLSREAGDMEAELERFKL
ncbi:methyl-accepting chemotaxis protein [Paludibacterium paludis]|uniref:Methyl-accepting chemotaxis protein n=1 Tax=Paludibacterium paludis TaxID=1225769 RepID=A0A918NZH8_9NEIS|nr:methyl-accepting chemotaxis protein [Paludibacterium paludis]GGY09513.1 methyl-accepting chemotaxis protein [Paludibacterium paludis]